jgi:hypothetical protein
MEPHRVQVLMSVAGLGRVVFTQPRSIPDSGLGPKGGPLCPDKRTSAPLACLSEINPSISAPFRSTAANALIACGNRERLAARQPGCYFGPETAMRRRICMRTVVCRVKQQHNRNRRECNGSDKDTYHCTRNSRQEASPTTRKPPEGSSPEASWTVEIGYIRQFNDTRSRNLAT